MESEKGYTKHKGGRPRKEVKRSEQLAVMCTMVERTIIEQKAKIANVSVSEFLRALGLKGQVDIGKKALPKEVLQGIANVNHIAANVNQIARKRNSFDELNPIERAELQYIVGQLKQFINDFKNYFK
ncbi:MAG: mobilization protein [Flavobacterium sp.]|nr:MAG: mobilization protein [Flavobacterium sp.]